jgi:hypothetical protein
VGDGEDGGEAEEEEEGGPGPAVGGCAVGWGENGEGCEEAKEGDESCIGDLTSWGTVEPIIQRRVVASNDKSDDSDI